jgi:tetratricopeptide (TPR) repeat protein
MCMPMSGRAFAIAALATAGIGLASSARAHDIDIPVNELARGVERVEKTLAHYQTRPVLDDGPDDRDHRIALGAAEIDFALGETGRALRTILAQLEDPTFRRTPHYVPSLLLASEILERSGDDFGAMAYARRALEVGGPPEQMAEAGARWFELSRRWQRLEPRDEVFDLWRARGGEAAADSDLAASVMYEAAFALRAQGEPAEARRLLQKVPSGSPHGSRAAYLAGVIFVEEGDLANAERWFAAIMSWPVPDDLSADEALDRENEVRALAALSAGRLRYERGDLEAALEAYREVGEASDHFDEACWEQAFLTLELERPRAAMDHLKCVTDLGAGGKRRIDARLFEASLYAHLERYAASLALYEDLHARFSKELELVDRTLVRITEPAEFLFGNMERSAMDRDPVLSPGPPTLFADAWTTEVDAAYRVDAGVERVAGDVDVLAGTLSDYEARLGSIDAFPEVRFRRDNLERLLVEVDHLIGHAGELEMTSRASLEVADVGGHPGEHAEVGALIARLRRTRVQTEAQLAELTSRAERRLAAARAEIAAIRRELAAIRAEVRTVDAAAEPLADEVACAALDAIREDFADASMRAEVGVLDTYWVRKQQRTRAIEALLEQKKETERQMEEAVRASRE